MSTQTVKLIKPWGLNPKGALITPPEGVAVELIRSGRAEAVSAELDKTDDKKSPKDSKGKK
jgi:hypothetical protein